MQPFLDETCFSTFCLWLTSAKIGERRQSLTDRGNQREIAKGIDYDYKVGDKVLVINKGIPRKAECVCVLTRPPVRGGRWATQVYRDSPRAPPT